MNYQKQAQQFAEKHGIKLAVVEESYGKHFPDDDQSRSIFKLRLSRNGKQYTFNFGQSIVNAGVEPTMYDALTCLEKYDPEDFENFCGNYGYDEDSRKAYRTYIAVGKEFEAVDRLFGDIIEELQEIQ